MTALQTEIRLNNLKTVVLRLESSSKNPVGDGNVLLAPLCEGIETVFRLGLKSSVFGLKKWDYWSWIEALINHLQNDKHKLAYIHVVTFVKSCKKINSYQGYGRQFIRLALMKRLLPYTVQTLTANSTVLKYWYNENAVLRDKVMRETFMEILKEINEHVFALDLKSCSFLDETWLIPEIRHVDIVPCKELGLIVRTVNGRVMVACVRKNSAAEDAGIAYGDTLDEMLGIFLYKAKAGRVVDLLRRNTGRPVSCTLVKGKLPTGQFFPPASERMAVITADPYKDEEGSDLDKAPQQLAGFEETPVHASDTIAIYSATYYGKLAVGENGGIAVIEDSILQVLKQINKPRAVYLNLSETNIVVTDQQTSQVLGIHSFTETSSCGRRADRKEMIAFVSGETTCTLAKSFYCYVFEMTTERIAKVVLYSIADGFLRTVWFV
ncbi:hypothetical protein OS493_017878 [Desmophyllum pertusum]|uniref:RUN domain-containing protein n=1 Tax=Desmophyllum pertusum TaxID=174260 RepID=A0A9W9Z023_9CNID|nr:hypothetical protein OS493_017878 [Desmophyllum pertusum]